MSLWRWFVVVWLACWPTLGLAQTAPFQQLDAHTGAVLNERVFVGLFAPSASGASAVALPTTLGDNGGFRVDLVGGSVGVTGTVAVTQSGTWTVQPGNTANTTAWLVTGTGGTFPVTGTFWQATQPVSGTFWQATQPVSGTFWQTTQPVSAATLPLPTGATTLLDGTLAATVTAAALGTGATTRILVQNDPDNTVDVLCGNATTQSVQLVPGQGMSLDVDNLNDVYCRTVSGTGTVNYAAR